jgi:hypothetical protein
MRHARLILNVLGFCLAATGSIWIGWIYAGAQLNASKPSPVVITPRADELRPAGGGPLDQYQDLGLLPNPSSLDLIPGVPGMMGDAAEIDGFPTVSKDAIERAAGYSDDLLPAVEVPIQVSPDPSNTAGGLTP